MKYNDSAPTSTYQSGNKRTNCPHVRIGVQSADQRLQCGKALNIEGVNRRALKRYQCGMPVNNAIDHSSVLQEGLT
ncbi:hypothetical protein [Cupriavidus sp. YAF13]|uniref:hypothetical protein n=1 Tax=Cupriavidus sp. YAF13 TaxID=3233075 RepID=UPI003F927052